MEAVSWATSSRSTNHALPHRHALRRGTESNHARPLRLAWRGRCAAGNRGPRHSQHAGRMAARLRRHRLRTGAPRLRSHRGGHDGQPARQSLRRMRLHRSRQPPGLAGGEVPRPPHPRRRLLRRAAPIHAGLHRARRRSFPAAQISALDARDTAGRNLDRFADRSALHRTQCGSAHRRGHGSADGVCGLHPHAGGDGGAGQRRNPHRPHHFGESRCAAEECAGPRAGRQDHSLCRRR